MNYPYAYFRAKVFTIWVQGILGHVFLTASRNVGVCMTIFPTPRMVSVYLQYTLHRKPVRIISATLNGYKALIEPFKPFKRPG